jgi:hypothetical protein
MTHVASDIADAAAAWGAAGTWAGVIFVILTTIYAVRTFGRLRDQVADQKAANARQAEVLALQGEELRAAATERERQAVERHREQAAKVTIRLDTAAHTTEQPTTRYTVSINNASPSPVYNLRLNWYHGTTPWRYNGTDVNELPHLMPGVDEQRSRFREDGDLVTLGAVLEFTDAAGVRWRRQLGGELTELGDKGCD